MRSCWYAPASHWLDLDFWGGSPDVGSQISRRHHLRRRPAHHLHCDACHTSFPTRRAAGAQCSRTAQAVLGSRPACWRPFNLRARGSEHRRGAVLARHSPCRCPAGHALGQYQPAMLGDLYPAPAAVIDSVVGLHGQAPFLRGSLVIARSSTASNHGSPSCEPSSVANGRPSSP